MTETLAHWYSSESTPWELSNEYQDDRVWMVFNDLCVLVILTKVASALEGLKLFYLKDRSFKNRTIFTSLIRLWEIERNLQKLPAETCVHTADTMYNSSHWLEFWVKKFLVYLDKIGLWRRWTWQRYIDITYLCFRTLPEIIVCISDTFQNNFWTSLQGLVAQLG